MCGGPLDEDGTCSSCDTDTEKEPEEEETEKTEEDW